MAIPEGGPLRSAEFEVREGRRAMEGPVTVLALRISRSGEEGAPPSPPPPRSSVLYRGSPLYRGVWREVGFVPPAGEAYEPLPEARRVERKTPPSSSRVDWIDVTAWVLCVGGAVGSAFLLERGVAEDNQYLQATGGALATSVGLWTLMEILDRSSAHRDPHASRGLRLGVALAAGTAEWLVIKYARVPVNDLSYPPINTGGAEAPPEEKPPIVVLTRIPRPIFPINPNLFPRKDTKFPVSEYGP